MIKLKCVKSSFGNVFIAGKEYSARPLITPEGSEYKRYSIESEDYSIDDGYIIWVHENGHVIIPAIDEFYELELVSN